MSRRPSSPPGNAPLRPGTAGGHVRIFDPELASATQAIECESGDTVAVGLRNDRARILLSADDVLTTLPRRSGDVGMPTVEMTAEEAEALIRLLQLRVWAIQHRGR